jgi:hypothetical protein
MTSSCVMLLPPEGAERRVMVRRRGILYRHHPRAEVNDGRERYLEQAAQLRVLLGLDRVHEQSERMEVSGSEKPVE